MHMIFEQKYPKPAIVKDTKFDEISILVLTLLSKVKNKMEILSILRPCQNIIELSLTE